MVESNVGYDMLFNMFNSAMGGALWIGIAILVAVISGLLAWYILQKRKYNIKCIIFYHDAFGNKMSESRLGGSFYDKKTKHKRFWFKHLKSYTIDEKDIRIVPEIEGNKIINKAYFLKHSDVDIRPIEWDFNKDAGINAHPHEHDANWMTTAFEKYKETIWGSSWMQWLPMISFMFISVLILIMMWSLMKKFDVIGEASNNLAQAASQIKDAALALNGGLPSGSIIK